MTVAPAGVHHLDAEPTPQHLIAANPATPDRTPNPEAQRRERVNPFARRAPIVAPANLEFGTQTP